MFLYSIGRNRRTTMYFNFIKEDALQRIVNIAFNKSNKDSRVKTPSLVVPFIDFLAKEDLFIQFLND
ncbi:MAG: hypothetical protein ACTSXF_15060, partial [Promethearchaeota archaeon]